MLIIWEETTHVAEESVPGLLSQSTATPLTLAASLIILILLWPTLSLASIPTALLFGRLVALDLTTYTLPNIYTLPLLAIGLCHAALHGLLPQFVVAAILICAFGWLLTLANINLGGGDLKLLAAMFAFLPITAAFWAIAVGCLFFLPVTFLKPKAMVPFGVPIIIGWVALLGWPHLPNWLISTIS